MPSMDGFSTIPILKKLNPQVKIIACGGSVAYDSLSHNVDIQAFLQKPFTSEDLLNTLHRTIAGD
jgi:CheY-like chemotaxis protein